jgi:transcription initiation factor TFIIIB Brf1 subunit/transcription initiation factor TFIIB
MSDQDKRNMYGLLPCPECGSKCRWPTQQGENKCDECGHTVPHIKPKDGDWRFDDVTV